MSLRHSNHTSSFWINTFATDIPDRYSKRSPAISTISTRVCKWFINRMQKWREKTGVTFAMWYMEATRYANQNVKYHNQNLSHRRLNFKKRWWLSQSRFHLIYMNWHFPKQPNLDNIWAEDPWWFCTRNTVNYIFSRTQFARCWSRRFVVMY